MGKIIMNKKILILLVALFIGTQVGADSVSVPNTFVDGTTASASEVNANFDAVTSAINNIRSINVYVNGVRRGALIDSASGGGENNFTNAIAFRILLDSSYIAFLSTAGDGLRETALLYLSADCTGQPYYPIDTNPVLARQGIVFTNDSPALNTLYYIYAGSNVETITIESSLKDGVCNPSGAPIPNINAVKAYVNDSALTGVTQTDFIGDVTIGF